MGNDRDRRGTWSNDHAREAMPHYFDFHKATKRRFEESDSSEFAQRVSESLPILKERDEIWNSPSRTLIPFHIIPFFQLLAPPPCLHYQPFLYYLSTHFALIERRNFEPNIIAILFTEPWKIKNFRYTTTSCYCWSSLDRLDIIHVPSPSHLGDESQCKASCMKKFQYEYTKINSKEQNKKDEQKEAD